MENYLNEIYYNENGIDYDSIYDNDTTKQEIYAPYDNMQQQEDVSLDNTFAGFLLMIYAVFFGLLFITSIVRIISEFKILKKAVKAGWIAFVPVYSTISFLDVAGLPIWLIVLSFIPVGNIIFAILLKINLAKKFGKSTFFGIGMLLLPLIFYPILAFGKSQYEGVSNNDDLPNNNDINNNMNNNNINPVNQINNEVVSNQESLSNELGFGPQINNTEVNMQPNMGINSNQLNQNINSNLQNNVEQVTTMSAIMENNNTNVENNIVNNIEVTPVRITDVENNVGNDEISISVEENNTNVEVVEEKPISFNNLTENQEILEKTNVLPNLSQININEVNTNVDNSFVVEPKPITLSDIVTGNNNEQSNNSNNISFGDLTNKIENINSVSNESVCQNCGSKYNPGDMFCTNCGSKLN